MSTGELDRSFSKIIFLWGFVSYIRMDYCPEIAVLHGTFACIQTESKAGKYDLLQHTKGDKSSRPYVLIKTVVQEIISGPGATSFSLSEQRVWSRHLHHILFCKAFVFNQHVASTKTDVERCGKVVTSLKAWCLPIPDFHPHLFMELSDEFEWTEYLGEMLAAVDLTTALTFAVHSLTFCTPDPSLLYDLHLMSMTLDLLLSLVFSGMMLEALQTESPPDDSTCLHKQAGTRWERKRGLFTTRTMMSQQKFKSLEKSCFEAAIQSEDVKTAEGESQEKVEQDHKLTGDLDQVTREEAVQTADQLMLDKILEEVDQDIEDHLTQLADLVLEVLTLLQKRLSTKLFDRKSCKTGAMSSVLPVLGHMLGSVIVLCTLSVSGPLTQQVRHCLNRCISREEDEEPDSGLGASCINGSVNGTGTESSHNQDESVDLVGEALCRVFKRHQMRRACMKCLSSFFTTQTTKAGSSQTLSTEKSVKFGRVLKLNLQLCRLARPVKLVGVVQELSELLTNQGKAGDGTAELRSCVSLIMRELQRREQAAEEKRRNPSLAEVMEKVGKKLPRWDWYLQYGLAKRDVTGWWCAGFLEFLHKDPSLLSKESDVRHLLAVLPLVSLKEHGTVHRDMCAQLISKTFSQLPSAVQDRFLLDTYRDPQWSGFLPAAHCEQALTVAFNKLSASSAQKNLRDVLPLALHDLLTFVDHAISTAVGNEGQIPVVVKVFQQIPTVLQCVHPLNHPHHTVLCHSLHTMLHGGPLDARQQKNCVHLVAALVTVNPDKTDTSQHPPLLPPAQFLSASVLPFITIHVADPPISTDFALRLLTGCVEATHSVGFSHWLEQVHPAVVVACCAGTLQDCLERVWEDREVDGAMTIKSLVLRAVEGLLKHVAEGGVRITGQSLGWLQERCADHHWTVWATLTPFLTPGDDPHADQLIAGYVKEGMMSAVENPLALLQLSAVSDSAMGQVMQALSDSDSVSIPQSSLILHLSQVLPQLLACQVCRLVQVLCALVRAGCVHMDLPHLSLLGDSGLHLPEGQVETVVCGMLTEAVVVVASQEPAFSDPFLHHLSQILVSALQALMAPLKENKGANSESCTLRAAMFLQVCAVMSVSPDVMVDSLFVVLLDILSDIVQQDHEPLDVPSSGSLEDVFLHGVELLPHQSLRETLIKKLNHQTIKKEVD